MQVMGVEQMWFGVQTSMTSVLNSLTVGSFASSTPSSPGRICLQIQLCVISIAME